jgi:putative SOS response-associated peptidase YedK
MCNDYGNRIPYSRYVEEFSHLRLPVFVQGNGPDLAPRDDIRIRDTAPVILRTPEGVELTERVWAPRAANKKPIFNFRSEKRDFTRTTRCLIPAGRSQAEAQEQMALYAGRRGLVLHRRHHPAGRHRWRAMLYHADDAARRGCCSVS